MYGTVSLCVHVMAVCAVVRLPWSALTVAGQRISGQKALNADVRDAARADYVSKHANGDLVRCLTMAQVCSALLSNHFQAST